LSLGFREHERPSSNPRTMLWPAIGANQTRSRELHMKAPVSAKHEN
jgi:hypothetical protein